MDGGFQSFLNMQNHFQSWHKVTNIGYYCDVFITISGQVFIYFYLLEESEVVALKSSIKKVFLNIPQNSRKTSPLESPLQ